MPSQNMLRNPLLRSLQRLLALMAVAALPALAGAQAGAVQPASTTPQSLSPTAPVVTPPTATAVRVTTNMGVFVVELQSDRAPLTVQNFLRYVYEGFYTNTLFHRVVGSFVVQGVGMTPPRRN